MNVFDDCSPLAEARFQHDPPIKSRGRGTVRIKLAIPRNETAKYLHWLIIANPTVRLRGCVEGSIIDRKRMMDYIWSHSLLLVNPCPIAEVCMSEESRSEPFVRFSQGGLLLALCLVLAMGIVGLAVVARPELGFGWMATFSWMLPMAIAIGLALQRSTLRGNRWKPDAPQVQAVLRDEWRRQAMDRAFRLAFVTMPIVQLPLALVLGSLPGKRAVMGMAVATSVLGLATFLALTLIFGRAAADE